jgi:branched-chain amino acid transport system substrate-binding protein
VGVLRAGVSLGLTGRYAVQSAQVRAGLDLWAADQRVELVIIDDRGSPSRAVAAYDGLLADGIELLLGPMAVGRCGMSPRSYAGRAVAVEPRGRGRRPRFAAARHRGRAGVDLPRQPAGVGPGRRARQRAPGHRQGRFAEQVANGGRRAAASLGLRTRRVESGNVGALVKATATRRSASLADAVLVVAGTFEEDLAVVRRVREARVEVGLLGCVAAGIDEFGRRLGPLADGLVGPAQWWCRDHRVDVGPSGPEFGRRFEGRVGHSPDYLAAQAAAAGYLAAEASARGYGADEVRRWQADSLLGPFRLDGSWRQAGYVPVAVQWRRGRRVLAAEPRP